MSATLNFTAQPIDSRPMPWDRAPEADSTEPPPAPAPWLKSSESANQASVESVETPSTATTAKPEISESASQASVESVETPQAAPITTSNQAFLSALFADKRADELLWACNFPGHPKHEPRWAGHRLLGALNDHPSENTYFSVATLKPDEKGKVARRKANFSRQFVVVLDDTPPLPGVEPTWVLETSQPEGQSNTQVGFLLSDPLADAGIADRLQKALADAGHLPNDKSGNNIVRYVRLPVGSNTKYNPAHPHRLLAWNPEHKVLLSDLVNALGLDLDSILNEPPAPQQTQQRETHTAHDAGLRGESFFAKVNTKALGNLPAWVVTLFPSAKPYQDGYRITSADLGRQLEEDISILPQGAWDFGEERGKSAIDLVIDWGPATTAQEAALWLCKLIGIEPAALGWQDSPQGAGSAEHGAQVAAAMGVGQGGGEAPEWQEPEPLPEGLPAVAPFDPAMLPGALRPWISDIAERMQCPADFPAAASVVCLAAVVGRQVAIRPKRHDDWTVVPNLWGAIIGRPSLLKSPALAEPMRLVDGLEGKARAAYEDAIREYKAQARVDAINNKLADQDIQKALKAGDKSKALDMAFDVSNEIEVPARRRYRTSDATIEKLGELLTANPRGLMLFRDELVGFLRSLDKEGREGSRAFFLEAWNGNGGFTFDRIGRGTVEIEAACLSLLGGIQPGPLTAYLTETLRGGAGDDGLLQRFQVTVWPDPPAAWRNVDRRPDASARQAARDVFERLDAIDPAMIGATQDDEDALPWLRFDDEAQDLFDGWRTDLEHRLRAGDLPVALEAHLAKYRSLLPSLALLFHLADNAQGRAVGKPSLLRARAWCEYLETHANRLFAPALAPDLFAAIELDKHLAELDEPFTAKDVYRNHWRGLDREGTALALSVLEDFGRIRGEKSTGPGRPTTLYRINPALQEGME